MTCGTVATTLSFKNSFFHLFHAGFIGKNKPPHNYFSKKKKQKETIKIIPHLACILVPKNCPTEKVFKRLILSLNGSISHTYTNI